MIKGAYRPIYSTLEEERLWEDIKSGKGIPPIVETNIPLQKNVPPMPKKKKKKKYKEKYSWIYDRKVQNWRCSHCYEIPKIMGYVGTEEFMNENFNYCPHCGAEMGEK